MRRGKLVFLSVAVSLLTGCFGDPGCYENTYIINQTKDTLYILKYYNDIDLKYDKSLTQKTIIVKPDSTALLWEKLGLGVPDMFTFTRFHPKRDSILVKYRGREFLLNMLDTNLYSRKESEQRYKSSNFKEVAFYRIIKDADFEAKNAISIDTLLSSFTADASLNDGGGCWYSETEADEKKDSWILVTQMDKKVRKAIVCVNRQMLVLKFDSVHYTGDTTKETETFEYYSGSGYHLLIDNFLKWENGNAEQELKSTMTIKAENGESATKHIIGTCGEN